MKALKFINILLATVATVAWAIPIRAATHTVTSLADSGPGSLRAAINGSPAGDSVNFAVTGIITLTSGELVIGRNLTIQGPGASNLTISGNENNRIFRVLAATFVEVYDLTISNGYTPTNAMRLGGGGILNQGTLRLVSCAIIQNDCNLAGGGIFNTGELFLLSSTLASNRVYRGHGGYTWGEGGAIWSSGTLGLTNCTLSDNQCSGSSGSAINGGAARGGGIWSEGSNVWLISCTVSGNSCLGGGAIPPFPTGWARGGGAYFGNVPTIVNTIVAGNSAVGSWIEGPDVYCASSVNSQGNNLIGKTNDSSGWIWSDLTGSAAAPLDPLLGPLQNNGGPTPTMAPWEGSATIDRGISYGLTTDQRGFPRPVDLVGYPNTVRDDGADIGAYEIQAVGLDIGLRGYEANGIIRIACESGSLTSPLRIVKNGTVYGILLVETNAPEASKIQAMTRSGIKAWKKLP